jgi:hypothetical protein
MSVDAAALRILMYAESLGVTIEHEPLTRDQSNLQETLITLQSLTRHPVNEGMALQECLPNIRKILPLTHQVGA